MEHFKGSLASYGLQLLVPALFERTLTDGILRVERGGTVRRFYFREGALVASSSSDPTEHLSQVLVRLGVLAPARAAAAFEAAEALGQPFGAFLVERGFVEQPRLLEALEHKAREALFDSYGWQSGELEFTPGAPALARGVELRLPLGSLHRDAVARLREWRVFRALFPAPDTRFRVYRQFAVEGVGEEEERLLALAEAGAALDELLAAPAEGPLFCARRLVQLYRRGALTPRTDAGSRVGEAAALAELLALARRHLAAGRFESAVALAAQALERAPVPEAQALYREAEARLAASLAEELRALEGRLHFEPLPRSAPAQLTADDLYLFAKLRGGRSVTQTLRSAAMGELAASRALRRLMAAGLVRLAPEGAGPQARRRTDPYGIPALR
ncbi:DUF4388 domain-containing protein [Aggregicoccus sp. 17bor-14]|uniref:DUF4388 domain-containing protein n=1 Tax=Myxococcaceae TaxID=31 RepID=UPI00129CC7F6|nr:MULTISPECIES: DUF4388 domain-containing protein [Myxococcaceae]MBF5040922.1 DUF4388 domain-containing protein [Simulacricoccus sp. 17bor-14]MRI86710.1 DUF4388 domain-containing protein [Aggregicoccus sp. 17bor-14]